MPPASLASGLCPQLAPIVLLVCSNLFMTIGKAISSSSWFRS